MVQQTSSDTSAPAPVERKTFSERVLSWQDALDTRWKQWAERAFLRFAQVATWAYVVTVVVVWLSLHLVGDQWWAASLLLFGPRWLGLLPLLLLVPLAIVLKRRLLVPLTVVTFLFVFGVLGFCIPWPWESWGADPARSVNLLTCNVHGGEGGWDPVLQLIHQESPDVMALQELGPENHLAFPEDWKVEREGSLLIASPYPTRDVRTWYFNDPAIKEPQLRAMYVTVELPGRKVGVCNVHLTSPHQGLTKVLDRHTLVSLNRTERLKELNRLRRRESEALSVWIRELPQVDILMGDFNLPIESRIYQRSWGDYQNVFDNVGFGVGYTRWVMLHNFQYGVRIDHVLTTDDWISEECFIGRDIGSDHLPVIAKVAWR